jgi:hypothetical protein
LDCVQPAAAFICQPAGRGWTHPLPKNLPSNSPTSFFPAQPLDCVQPAAAFFCQPAGRGWTHDLPKTSLPIPHKPLPAAALWTACSLLPLSSASLLAGAGRTTSPKTSLPIPPPASFARSRLRHQSGSRLPQSKAFGKIDTPRRISSSSVALKAILFLPPVIAAVAVAAWLANGRGAITTLEEQSTVLRQRLAARSSSLTENSTTRPDTPTKSQDVKMPLDWKEFAAQMQEMRSSGGMSDIRSTIRLQQRIQSMTRDELVNALDEIAALDLPADSKEMLEQLLFGPLSQKDPEFALNRFADHLSEVNGGFGWQLSNAMKVWTAKNPAAATAWFDQQIAAGKFDSKSLDGKSNSRMRFEGSLIGTLLSTDPAAASSRLQALPEEQRKEVLENHAANSIKEEDQLAFATLVRQELPAMDQAEVIAQQCSRMAWGEGYTKVDEYLDRIKATPAERAAAVNDTVSSKVSQLTQNKKITGEDIAGFREWASTQSPDTTDKFTGSVIAKSMSSPNKLDFSEAAALATEYHTRSGNDDVLVEFFKNNWQARQNKDEAIQLAEKISDPARRAKVIESFN